MIKNYKSPDIGRDAGSGKTKVNHWYSTLLIIFLLSLTTGFDLNAQTYQIGSGTTTSSASGITPFTTLYEDGKSQYLILASELTAAGATAGNYTQFAFNFTTLGSPAPNNVTLKMGHTAATTLGALDTTTPLTTVYSPGTVTPVVGWNTWNLSTPFNWNGTSNILVQICFNNAAWSTNYTVQTTQFAVGVSYTFGLFADAVDGCAMTTSVNSPPSAANRRHRPNMRLTKPSVTPPNCATGLSPLDLATNVSRNATFSWTAATGGPTGYDVYMDTSPTPTTLVSSNQPGLTYNPASLLAANTLYYWKVVPRNINGPAVGCSTQSFTTGTAVIYCSTTYTNGCNAGSDAIVNVTLGTLNNTSGCAASPYYTFFNAVTVPDVTPNTSINVVVSMGADGTQAAAVWIDFNQNGNFEASEGAVSPLLGANGVATIPLNVPAGAILGNTRMRVRGGNDVVLTTSQACGVSSNTWGETEDYIVNIVPPPTCPPASALTVTGVTTSNATLNWTAAPGTPLSYEWEIRTSGAGGSGAVGLADSGTVAVPTTTATSTALTAQTSYTAYVRAFCGGTDYSTWIASATFGTPCNPTTTLPSTEGFEGTAPCWQAIPISGAGNWALYTTIAGEVPAPHSGAQFAGINWSSTVSTNALLVSPPYNISANGAAQTRVKVWIYRATNGQAINRITVRVHTSATVGGTMILDIPRNIAQAPTAPSAGWYEYIANVPTSYNGSTFYITAQGAVGTNATNDWSLGFDDYALEFNPPTIATLSQSSVCNSGDDAARTVVITGANFVGATAVAFNGTAAQSFVVDSATQITAIVATGSTSGTVSVTGPGGTASSVGTVSVYGDYPFYVDADGDTYGVGSTVNVCSINGTTPPTGYALNNTDCNDGDVNAWQDDQLYTDVDGDGYDAGDLGVVCYGASLPAGTSLTTLGPDCDDNDNAVYQDDVLYTDADGDGYDAGNLGLVCYGATLPAGTSTTTLGTDCNDSVAAVNPGQSEILYNGVDDNCNGQLDEGNQITTQIVASQCGTTLAAIGTNISAVSTPQATMYRFEVTNTVTNAIQMIEKPVQYFNFTQLASYDYETTYSIRVMLQRNGVWLGYYGSACLVSTPPITQPGGAAQISPSQCGITLSSINTLIATTSTPGATSYRFKVTNISDPTAPNQVQQIDRSLHWFNLPMLANYNYGTTYIIEVALKTSGNYSAFGNACQITAPPVPAITPCGGIIAQSNTYIYTTSLAKVTSYRFEITNLVNNNVTTLDRSQNWFTFNHVPGYAQGTQYGVRVAVMTAGHYSLFGDACEITSPGTARPEGPKSDVTAKEAFAAVAYPNPFAENFMIDVKTSSEAQVNIKVYDMTGRILDVRTVNVSEMESQEIGGNYPAGVYNVVVSQGEEVKTLRVVKR